MQLFKKQLEVLFLVTKGTEGVLNLKEARIRDSFMKPLIEVTTNFEKDRRDIYEEFCKKDEEGNAEIANGSYQFDNSVIEDLNKELAVLLDESVEIETPDGIKELLEKTDYCPKTGEAEIIDEILAKF